ncbi:MAG: hypothetical protein RCG15_05320 [Candidatus Rickettsia vulgarisii]
MKVFSTSWFSSKSTSVVNAVKKTIDKVEKITHKITHKFDAKIAHSTTNLAYKLAEGNDAYKKHESETINNLKSDGWKVLCNSSKFADTNQNGYKAVAFINNNTKEILIATAGTVPTDLHDLKDDVWIAAGTFPSKVVQAKAMVNHVCELLEANAGNYTFNVTGHSLGAVLTDVTAFEIKSKGLNLGTSITFDSPGSKNSINKAIKAGVFSKDVDVTIKDLKEHCVVYNSAHNAINYNPIKSSPHITEPKLVLFKQAATDTPTQQITESSGIIGYTSYLVSKVSSNVVNTCSYYLGITKVANELEKLKGHSLENFANLCEKPIIDTEGWEKTAGKLYIKDFKGSNSVTSTGNDVVVIKEEEIDPDTISISLSEYSYDDLHRAHSYDGDNTSVSGDIEFQDLEFIN